MSGMASVRITPHMPCRNAYPTPHPDALNAKDLNEMSELRVCVGDDAQLQPHPVSEFYKHLYIVS